MFAIVFLCISALLGWSLCCRLLPENVQNNFFKIPLSLILGIVPSIWLVFLLNLFLPLYPSFIIALYILVVSMLFILPTKKRHIIIPRASIFDIGIFLVCIGISLFVVNQSLHFTSNTFLEIAANCWGDFDLHLPFISSFALGSNMPPALPSFPNANAAYHFMFDYWSGVITFGGLPLSYAFNIVSIIAFSSLLFLVYTLFTFLFRDKKIIGIMSILFFLFNSTLTFIEKYPKLQPKNIFDYFYKITQNNHYLSTGPFTTDHVSIIWNLNVYLNQRHLILAFAIGIALLLLTYFFTKHHIKIVQIIFLGVFVGLLPFFSIHVFLCLLIFYTIFGVLSFKDNRRLLFILPIAIIIATPQILWLSHDVHNMLQWNPGFLAPRPLTFSGIFIYWLYNLGLSLFTIPLGFFFADKKQKIWFISLLGVFIIANLVQFNSELFNNHKLFNFWILFANGYTAYFIYRLGIIKHWWKWIIIPVLLVLLTLSGVIDFFVIKNEVFYSVSDVGGDAFITWTAEHTPKNAIFLIPVDSMYNPIRMAGRKTYAPSPRFTESFGYNVVERNNIIQKIYSSEDPQLTYSLLKQNHISYIEIPKENQTSITINSNYFLRNFPTIYSDSAMIIVAVP